MQQRAGLPFGYRDQFNLQIAQRKVLFQVQNNEIFTFNNDILLCTFYSIGLNMSQIAEISILIFLKLLQDSNDMAGSAN